MKTLFTTVAAGLLAISFVASADAATKSTTKSEARQHLAQREAACKSQAAKKVSAVHFIKRRALVNECMGRTAQAKTVKTHQAKAVTTNKVKTVKMQPKAAPTTTGQAVK